MVSASNILKYFIIICSSSTFLLASFHNELAGRFFFRVSLTASLLKSSGLFWIF